MLAQLKLIRNGIAVNGGEYVDATEVHGTLMLAEREQGGLTAHDLILIGPESQVIIVAQNIDPVIVKEAIWA